MAAGVERSRRPGEGRLRHRRRRGQLHLPDDGDVPAGVLHRHLRDHGGGGGDAASWWCASGTRSSIRSWASSPTARTRGGGSSGPWILWTAVPFGIMGFLTFTDAAVRRARQARLRLRDVHRADDGLLGEQPAVLGAERRDDRGPRRAHEPLVVPLRLRDERARSSSRGSRCRWCSYFGQGDSAKGLPVHDGHLLGAGRRLLLHHVRHDEGAHPAPTRRRSRPIRQDFARPD